MAYNELCLRFNDYLANSYNSHLGKIELNLTRDPGFFWKFINNKRTISSYPSRMYYNGTCGDDTYSILNLFADFFGSAFEASSIMGKLNLLILYIISIFLL